MASPSGWLHTLPVAWSNQVMALPHSPPRLPNQIGWSAIFLTVLVYSLNMFGDAVRDLLDPRLRSDGGRLGREPAKPRQG